MTSRDLVVVGASAGGVEPLRSLVAGLPPDFAATVLVVLHIPESAPSALPQILGRSSALPVRHAADGDQLRLGEVLVAPPGHHLVVDRSRVALSRGPRENGHRPAVDVLFRSAARAAGPRVVGVILSGGLDDGTAGLLAIQTRGGVGLAQEPDEALHPSMPSSAIREGAVQGVLPVHDIPAELVRLVAQHVDAELAPPPSTLLEVETDMTDLHPESVSDSDRPGEPASLACPDCAGTLFRLPDGQFLRFRCRVGHAWSAESLVAQQSSALENALWMALRTLEEKAALTGDLRERALAKGHRLSAENFARQRRDAQHASLLVRDLLTRIASGVVDLTSTARTTTQPT